MESTIYYCKYSAIESIFTYLESRYTAKRGKNLMNITNSNRTTVMIGYDEVGINDEFNCQLMIALPFSLSSFLFGRPGFGFAFGLEIESILFANFPNDIIISKFEPFRDWYK